MKSPKTHQSTPRARTPLQTRNDALARLKRLCARFQASTGAERDRVIRAANVLYLRYGLTLNDLAEALECSPSRVSTYFKRLDIPAHSSSHRRAGHVPARSIALARPDAFETIETPEKAYLLGILIADAKPRIRMRRSGRIKKKVHEGLEYIVAQRDRWVLQFLKTQLGSAARIREVPAVLNHRGRTKRYTDLSLIVYSTELARDLAALGVVPGRTPQNLPMPKLRPDLKRHFVRGLLDGDGWITRDSRVLDPLKGWSCGVCGSEAVVSYVRRFAKAQGLTAPPISTNGAHSLKVQWSGVKAIRMLGILYGAHDPALPRKKNLARAIVEAFHATYPNGAEGSVRYQVREGRQCKYLTDALRRETPHARALARTAVKIWKHHMHPTRGRRKRS
jgi:hypothetical protein